jgi:predicted Zn-dependent peptidase
VAFARARERLGASITNAALPDSTAFQLDAMVPNLPGSLALLSDYIRKPALKDADLERVRAQQLAAIDAELRDPSAMATRVLYPALYGDKHPYGTPPTGTGDPAVVKRLTRADLATFHDAWLRPSKATIFVVGDTTLAALKPLLERSFGTWAEPASPAPVKSLAAAIPAPRPRILLIDRPASPQSMIMAGEVLDATGRDDLVPLRSANEVLGGSFLSRLNMDLREAKGWSYGVGSAVSERVGPVIYRVVAPVQTDQTGPRSPPCAPIWPRSSRTRASPPTNWPGPRRAPHANCPAPSKPRQRCSAGWSRTPSSSAPTTITPASRSATPP